ncbi:hypothetical protein B0H63DRAFT_519132 [Podospora didyma]|uniref:Uncharacterized protein n=1 Tax=Podospora didyma TaxID=330526 RepID=A0AAE0NYB1_9PEZI|nr:hypothetical protein B0H63DRAFT_519132 [Podospora didyma]
MIFSQLITLLAISASAVVGTTTSDTATAPTITASRITPTRHEYPMAGISDGVKTTTATTIAVLTTTVIEVPTAIITEDPTSTIIDAPTSLRSEEEAPHENETTTDCQTTGDPLSIGDLLCRLETVEDRCDLVRIIIRASAIVFDAEELIDLVVNGVLENLGEPPVEPYDDYDEALELLPRVLRAVVARLCEIRETAQDTVIAPVKVLL